MKQDRGEGVELAFRSVLVYRPADENGYDQKTRHTMANCLGDTSAECSPKVWGVFLTMGELKAEDFCP